MGLLTIDIEKCARDGICIEVCPINLLTAGPDGRPEIVAGGESHCIGCGHCVAACPNAALDNRKNPLSAQAPIPLEYYPDPKAAALFLRSRRSIRKYMEDAIPHDRILRLLDIARFCPSGFNSQGISYLIVQDAENLDRIRRIVLEWMKETIRQDPEMAEKFRLPAVIRAQEEGSDRILRNAPNLIVAHAPVDLRPAQVTTCLALEYVELYAPSLGIGTCWAGFAMLCAERFPFFQEFLKIPENRRITGMLMAGYPKYVYYRLPARNPLDVAWFSGLSKSDDGRGEVR